MLQLWSQEVNDSQCPSVQDTQQAAAKQVASQGRPALSPASCDTTRFLLSQRTHKRTLLEKRHKVKAKVG